MGGLCGYVGSAGSADEMRAGEVLGRMLARIRHRGPAASAEDVHAGVGLAMNARARDAGTNALRIGKSADGKVRCALAGTVDLTALSALRTARARGAEASTTDLVADLFARHGEGALARLNGPFALAVDDGKTLLLARDPLGECPLYYTRTGRALLFSSEVKAFLADPTFRARPRKDSLNKLLAFSFIPGNESMFEGVSELLPGELLACPRGGEPSRRVYWDLREELGDEDEATYVATTAKLTRQAVLRRLRDGERVAAFLSGGVDSSAIVALLAEHGVDVTAYSASFGHGQPNELMYARLVAEHCHVRHRVIDIDPNQFVDLLPQIVYALDDPLCDCITVPNFLLAREAAQDADVVFNGEGGDPLFGGPKNKFLILGEWYAFLGGYDRADAYLASYHKFYDYLGHLCTPELLAETGGAAALVDVVRPYLEKGSLAHFLNRLMYINIKLKGGQNILVKVDKMLSQHGVRAASPLFDRDLAEYSFCVPAAFKRKGDVEKYVFKKAVESLLPRPVVYRKKAGMGVPLNHWFKVTALRDYAGDLLLSPRARERGYFRQEFVQSLLGGHGAPNAIGQDRTGELLWMLLAIEIWHRVYVDGEGSFS